MGSCFGCKMAQRDITLADADPESSDEDSGAGSEGAVGVPYPSPRRSPRGGEVVELAQWKVGRRLWGWCACDFDVCPGASPIETGAGEVLQGSGPRSGSSPTRRFGPEIPPLNLSAPAAPKKKKPKPRM